MMNRVVRAVFAAAVVAGCGSAWADVPASAYVQNGLILHYDGIENAGVGLPHDGDAKTWADLSGYGRTGTLGTYAKFTENSLDMFVTTPPSGDGKLGQWGVATTTDLSGIGTIETFSKPTGGVANARTLWAGYPSYTSLPTAAMRVSSDDSTPALGANSSCSPSWGTLSFSNFWHVGYVSIGNNKWQPFVSGALVAGKSTTQAPTTTGLSFGGFDRYNRTLYGNLYAVRIYNRALTSGEVACNANVDRMRFEGMAPDELTWPEDYRWNAETRKVEIRTRVMAVGSGKVAVGDETATSFFEIWTVFGTELRIAVTPDEGVPFQGWQGGEPAATETPGVYSYTVGTAAELKAVMGGAERTWVGGTDNLWSTEANWDPVGVPQAGERVSVPASKSVIVTEDMPKLATFDLAGTLTCSNWFTAVRADTVTVTKGGTITCGEAFTQSQMSNRVWIVCRDLDVQSGGTINVNDKGWCAGSGPSRPDGYAGGAHGGYGAKPFSTTKCTQWNAIPYGDAETPLDPGEGGNKSGYVGGGAVLVEASGMVTVSGDIKASATKTTFSAGAGMGAGGSICIRSKRFRGTGSLTADGAYGQTNWSCAETITSGECSHPGGGGCISVKYDPTVETDDDVNGMTISAAAGDLYVRYDSKTGKTSYHRTPAHADDFRQDAGIGQLWFTDNRMLKGSLGSKMTGALVYTNRFEFDSLTVTSGHVRFGAEGCQVNVAGDLVVSGKLARVEIGGYMATNRSTGVELYAGKVAPKLTVGGCLAVADEARLDVRAAETNGVEAYGAWVDVAGHFRIASNSYVYAWCDSFNGGAPRFTARSLTVETNGVFSADRRGFAAGSNRDGSSGTARCPVAGRGPGGGWPVSSGSLHGGGGHGGAGGLFGESGMGTTGMTNDFNVARPSLAGSGGGSNVAYGSAGHGGGVISVAVERDLVVHGKVTANGGGLKQYTGGAGAGGTILLEGKTFSGTGSLTANGEIGSRTSNGTKISGCGGGGRIAVWTGKSWIEGKSRMKHCTVSETPVTGMTFSGTATAAGGIHPYSDKYNGKDGTVRYVWYDGAPGLLLFVR